MSRGRKFTYLTMNFSIVRHLLSNEYGPFDRFLEIGVLLFVGYEVIATFIKERKANHRTKNVTARLETIRKFIARGQGLRHDAYAFVEQRSLPWFLTSADWIKQFDDWHREIQLLFTGKSERGKCYPSQTIDAYMRDEAQRDASYPGLPVTIQATFSHLQLRLINLHNIMEKPDVYL